MNKTLAEGLANLTYDLPLYFYRAGTLLEYRENAKCQVIPLPDKITWSEDSIYERNCRCGWL